MRKTFWCVTLVVSGVVAGGAVLHASAQPGGHGHTPPAGVHGLHRPHGPQDGHCELAAAFHAHMAQLHAELNLTDAQHDAVHAALRARHIDLAAAIRPVLQAKRTLINAVHADTPDEAAIRAAGESLGRSVGEAAVVISRVKAEVLQVAALSLEQSRTLDAIKARIDASVEHMLDTLHPPAENPR